MTQENLYFGFSKVLRVLCLPGWQTGPRSPKGHRAIIIRSASHVLSLTKYGGSSSKEPTIVIFGDKR